MTRTVYATHGIKPQSRAGHIEEMANERAWRKRYTSEAQDRHHLERDMELGILGEIDRLHPVGSGGTALETHPTLRPLRNHVWARRRPLYESATAAGLVIPPAHDRARSRQAWFFDVLAVGPGVTNCKVGDCVVVSCAVAADRGDILGEHIYEFLGDVPYVDMRTHENERRREEDGTVTAWKRRMSDAERRSGGDVLAVCEP